MSASEPAAAHPSTADGNASPLWLALHFPHLSLELMHRAGQADAEPLVITTGRGGRQCIFAANRAACHAGIRIGMDLSAALALCDGLQSRPRRCAEEEGAMSLLADWALQFSDHVHVLPQDFSILVEIGRSRRFFGGLDKLRRRLMSALRVLGFRARWCIAPTPLAAECMARAGMQLIASDDAQLMQLLRPLPLQILSLPTRDLAELQGMGLACIGDVLQLPRDGLARRLGPALLEMLDRLQGRREDPLPRFQPPPDFCQSLDLPAPLSHVPAITQALPLLLERMAAWLRARGLGADVLELRLRHEKHPDTRISIALLHPSRDVSHLLRLCAERLNTMRLPAAVTALGLRSLELSPLSHEHGNLPGEMRAQSGELKRLIERLQARLGREKVYGLRCLADHRPERAWARSGLHPPGAVGMPGGTSPALPQASRPIWLLPDPMPPDKAWRLMDGPCERIETGWWDQQDIRRDYHHACAADGQQWWIFRDLRHVGMPWRIQGLFG